jgi:DNA helicase HerA-like ATPase
VVKGLTKEEILQEKNTRGFVRAQAKKIGSWNNGRRSFDPVPWLPQPNQAVLVVRPKQQAVGKDALGYFPGTSYPVSINPHLLVTHNAAILGILGVGKSFLALELVERMISSGIKVVCLDLTNQYAEELGPFLDSAADTAARAELEKTGPTGKTNVKKNVEEGGSIREFTAKMKEQLDAFLNKDNARKLRILNPAQFEVWRQDSKPYANEASMATLTPTEITRIITESILEVLQSQGMTEQARCCILYEEAHSLIPEWNAVASDGDKTATNGTAKAILQGRKFGLGCLVITQRTANVTKSILNQCNTVFGLRVFDATGMEFLKNYIGEDYAGVLSTLEDRHAVVFGRASSCRDPVLTRLNDRADFFTEFRDPKPPQLVTAPKT